MIASNRELSIRLVLAGLLGLGFVVRLIGLGSFPFHQDELYTLIEATGLFHTTLEPGIRARPLYYLLHHPLLDLLPDTELGLRLPAFVFGILGLWVTWLVGSRLLGTAGGLIAVFVVVISPWHILVSGLARYWSLVYLTSLAAAWLLVRAYGTDRPRDYFAALGSFLIGAFTHPSFLFAAVGVAAGISLMRDDGRFGLRWPSRRAWTYLWLPMAGVVLLGLAALWITGSGSALRNFHGRGLTATLRLLPAVVESLSLTYLVAGVIGALLLAGAGSRLEWRRWGMMTLGGALSTAGFLSAASLWTDIYWTHAIAAVPLLLVSVAGLVELGRERLRSGRTALVSIAAAVLFAGVLPGTLSQLSDGSRFDYRPAFRDIQARDTAALVLTWPTATQVRYAPHLRALHLEREPGRLDSILSRERRLWVVSSVTRDGIAGDGSGHVARWLADNCRWTSSHQRPRFDYRQFRVDLHHCRSDDSRRPFTPGVLEASGPATD